MPALIELVREYQRAASPEEAERLSVEIVGRVIPMLRGLIQRDCQPRVVEDVSQDVCVAIIKGLHRFRGRTDATFWAWCAAITRHKCADSLRKEHRTVPMDPEDLTRLLDAAETVEPITESEMHRQQNALKALVGEGPCYQLLWWRYVEDWSRNEIARKLGLSPAAAHMRIRRCIEAARARVATGR